MDRMFSLIDVKSVNDGERVIKGIATTPSTDRMGDVVEPMGASFAEEIPLLWQHQHDQPVGHVRFGKPTKAGIPFTATIAQISEPGELQARVDLAWQSVKSLLVRAVSIGFRAIEYAFKDEGGIHFLKTEILELSLVTVPANVDCTITSIKSIDTGLLAATGQPQPDKADLTGAKLVPSTPVASGKSTAAPVVKSLPPKPKEGTMNIADQIKQFEATRQAKSARMTEIMSKAAEAGTTLDEQQSTEYDDLEAEVKSIDTHLTRLRSMEKSMAQAAAPVKTGIPDRPIAAPTVVRKSADSDEKFEGQNFTRMVIAKTLARIEDKSAIGIASERWGKTNPQLVQVIRAAVAGGGTEPGEWGAELAQADTRYTGDFIDYLYAQTVFDNLPLREVPANVHIKGQDGAATAYWVGQSKSIPVTKADFSDVTLTKLKVAALAVISKELLQDSSPSAELLVRDALVQASAQRVDQTFFSAAAAVANVSPAGILNGLTAIASSGNDLEGLIADVKALYAPFIAANNASGLHLVTTESLAKSISLMTNPLGAFAFPGVTNTGGTLLGDNLHAGGNIGAGDLIALKPSDIYKIGDRGVEVSLSTEAAIEMADNPAGASDTPTANGSVVSMFQTDSVAIKVVRPLNYAKRRASAVAYVGDGNYGAPTA